MEKEFRKVGNSEPVFFIAGGNELVRIWGTEGVDLRNYATPEQIKRATMHTTNKAFERYFQVSKEELQEMYEQTKCDTPVIPKKEKAHQLTS